jgi:hypothetical protein
LAIEEPLHVSDQTAIGSIPFFPLYRDEGLQAFSVATLPGSVHGDVHKRRRLPENRDIIQWHLID